MTKLYQLNKITAKLIASAGALALIAGLSISITPQAYAMDCLLDTNNDGNADTDIDTDGLANSNGFNNRLACGAEASATGTNSTAIGYFAKAEGGFATALGRGANASGERTTALGYFAIAPGQRSTSVGYSASAQGDRATSIGYSSVAGLYAVAVGGDGGDPDPDGTQALGDNSIVIGTDARDASFADTVIIGKGATATEAGQVILKDPDIFTILGNGNVGMGTASPIANLDINTGAADTTLILNNTGAQWEMKSKATNGRLIYKNLTDGGVPFKLGPTAVNGLLSVGTATADVVEVRGDLDVTGILTTGGPTCSGGCDAVFDADYDLPSIEEHAKAMYANKHLPEIGPTIPFAPINLSEQYGKVINELEKAHIYIAQINEEKQAMQTAIELQNQRLARMETLLAKIIGE